jgi:hypothetical protein
MDLATRCRQQKVDHAGLASPDAAFSPGGHQGLFPVQAPASPTTHSLDTVTLKGRAGINATANTSTQRVNQTERNT